MRIVDSDGILFPDSAIDSPTYVSIFSDSFTARSTSIVTASRI